MKQFYLLVFFTLTLSILMPIRPFIVQLTIDNYVAFNDYNGLMNMIFLLFVLLIFQGIAQYYHTYLSGWIGQNIICIIFQYGDGWVENVGFSNLIT